jgi:hypothetical protein
MKVDIEGMDSVCLEGLLSVEEKPKYISVEASATSIKDTFTQLHLLDQLAYTRFKIVPQLNITEQRCPNPAREGIFVDHRFEGGSSGLFGKEVPGEWRPLDSQMGLPADSSGLPHGRAEQWDLSQFSKSENKAIARNSV